MTASRLRGMLLYTIRWLHCSAQLEDDLIWKNQQTFFFLSTFSTMPPILPSDIKNKDKRSDIYKKQKLEKQKQKAEKRKQRAKEEEKNPELKEVSSRSDPCDRSKAHSLAFVYSRNVYEKMCQGQSRIHVKRMIPWFQTTAK